MESNKPPAPKKKAPTTVICLANVPNLCLDLTGNLQPRAACARTEHVWERTNAPAWAYVSGSAAIHRFDYSCSKCGMLA